MTVLVGDTMSPGRDDKSEVVVAPPPESVQLRHDCVETEQIVPAVLLCLKMICNSSFLFLPLKVWPPEVHIFLCRLKRTLSFKT